MAVADAGMTADTATRKRVTGSCSSHCWRNSEKGTGTAAAATATLVGGCKSLRVEAWPFP